MRKNPHDTYKYNKRAVVTSILLALLGIGFSVLGAVINQHQNPDDEELVGFFILFSLVCCYLAYTFFSKERQNRRQAFIRNYLHSNDFTTLEIKAKVLYIDHDSKKWTIIEKSLSYDNFTEPSIYRFSDISKIELLLDSQRLLSGTSQKQLKTYSYSLGEFCSRLTLVIYVGSPLKSVEKIVFLSRKTKTASKKFNRIFDTALETCEYLSELLLQYKNDEQDSRQRE